MTDTAPPAPIASLYSTVSRPGAPLAAIFCCEDGTLTEMTIREALAPDHADQHAHSGNDHANEHALRDRLRDRIHAIAACCTEYHAADCQPCTDGATRLLADEVQPELDRLRQRAEAAEREADRIDQLLIDERAITADLGRQVRDLREQLAGLRALHHQIGDLP